MAYNESMAYKSVAFGDSGVDLSACNESGYKLGRIYLNMDCLPAPALAPSEGGVEYNGGGLPCQPTLAIDIETFGADDFMDALSVAKAQVALVAVSNGSDVFIWDNPIAGVRPPLEKFDGIWVAHNGALFDYPILLRSGFDLNGTMQDTLANERLLRGGSVDIGGSLAKTMERRLGFSPKGQIDHVVWREPPPFPDDALMYSAADVAFLLDIFAAQMAAMGRRWSAYR